MGNERIQLTNKQRRFLKKFHKLLNKEFEELKDIEFEDDTLADLNTARLVVQIVLTKDSYNGGSYLNKIIEDYKYLIDR